ncbi:MAG: AMP-binding protein [Verrucomicrobia bacterium]|nr:AMP-binding protein [Verrucomicrobiota bacterium]
MDWSDWYKHYDELPSLQVRLRIVRELIAATLDECPAGPIRIVSLCAGDGRDVVGALANHSRRRDVTATLIDNHSESIQRGQAAAKQAGLERQIRFVEADATLAANYAGAVPADLVLLSGFLGHLRHEDVARLISSLPMFCNTNGCVIWNRHLVLNKGREQVAVIRELFQSNKFEELAFQTPDPDGFAVARVRFTGRTESLDAARVLFEFVGIDRLMATTLPSPTKTDAASMLPVNANGLEAGDSLPNASLDDAEQSIPSRLGQMVNLYSSKTAIGSGAWQPSYAELNVAANRFAHALLSRGGATGDRILLLMRHDAPLIAVVIGVIKAGRVVVVLNSTDPPARLEETLKDADARFIVTDPMNHGLAVQISRQAESVILFEKHGNGPVHDPEIKIAPDDLAFLIYTSGSTGQPKGVMQSHRNILHNVRRHTHGLGLRAEDRIVLLASLSGGQGLGTTWCALLNGAVLCPFPAAERGVVGLASWLAENKVTVFVSSVSVFRRFIKSLGEQEQISSVRIVRFASESATANDFASYKKHFADDCLLFTTFSSSETGSLTHQRFAKGDAISTGRLSVGRPQAGIEILLWDERGREVRDGEAGEIIVRSCYISPGYWQNDALTAARFSTSPAGARLYRTGDLGSRKSDGSLMFMGRRDNQVKVNGYRVELSEIEDAIAQQSEVESAIVVARTLPDYNIQLSAYVILETGRSCDVDLLRRRLRGSIPGYMVPAHFIFLDKFPLTPHGKIDRQALPLPAETNAAPRPVLKPRDVVERNVARIFESVLGSSSIGREDDFFDLGGTSLQSVEVLAAIEEVFNVALPPSALIENCTVERLARLLSDRAVIPSSRPLVELRASNRGRPLFLVHSGQGDVVTYGLLVRKLNERPVFGLQAVGVQGESWPLMSVPAMAERYLPEILAKDPTGPYLLGGTCMGGMVAFELARRLSAMGRTVSLLALMDSPTPPYSGRRSRWHEAVIDPLRDVFRILRWGVSRLIGSKISVRQLPSYRRFVAGMTGVANRRYRPGFYDGTVTLLLTADTEFPAGDSRPLIGRFARETRTITLPGKRSGLFVRPAVDELAKQLQRCLDEADPSLQTSLQNNCVACETAITTTSAMR